MLFSEPKIPQSCSKSRTRICYTVSVLFSEPKIPQFVSSFSQYKLTVTFQCSSASRKFLNAFYQFSESRWFTVSVLFSEPKIPQCGKRIVARQVYQMFQCSSASRKFLNLRASVRKRHRAHVSVLFSEPKIPQFDGEKPLRRIVFVSVLFSEPKIPQSFHKKNVPALCERFSALQRAENSSIDVEYRALDWLGRFQCSSASRKFLNFKVAVSVQNPIVFVSVLFSEPKIPQSVRKGTSAPSRKRFQCSSASRKFLNSGSGSGSGTSGTRFSALQRAENSSISFS